MNRLLSAAGERGASDLHLDPAGDHVRVRVRVDGVLLPHGELAAAELPRVVGRLKALAGLLAYRTDVPQEGRIPADRSPIGLEMRVATFPALDGERVAVRLPTGGEAASDLSALGLPPAALAGLRDALCRPEGVVLVTGPSGSGKTTTLYAALAEILSADITRSVVTVEDPVERRLSGAVQTEVAPERGLDFARSLRSLLRQDPDVLLVGEIRDRETAAIALEAGLTGHLVLSTIHAGSGPAVFTRLLEMGVEPFVLTTAVRGVLAQRLLRRACPACAATRSVATGSATTGCDACGDTGYRGRVVAAEWVPVDDALRAAILGRADGGALADASKSGAVTTLRESAGELVEAGLTTPEEVRRVLGS